MKVKLDYFSQRQGILAQNIANVDTPGYKAKDLAAPDFQKMMSENGSTTAKLRLTPPSAGTVIFGDNSIGDSKVITRASTSELNPNGNNVTIEDETALMAVNQVEFQKVMNLYGKAITMFKTAIGNANTGS